MGILLFSSRCPSPVFSQNERDILVHQNNKQIASLLRSGPHQYTPTERYRLCLAIGNSRDTLLIEQLNPLIDDPSALVRSGAVFALGLLPCQKSETWLTHVLETEADKEVLQQIVLALGRVGTAENLIQVMDHAQYSVIKPAWLKAVVYLFSRGLISEQLLSECAKSLESSNKTVRHTAAVALFRVRAPDRLLTIIDPIIRQANSDDPFVRYATARLLRKQQFIQKATLFQRFAQDPDWRVRYETALAIPAIFSSVQHSWELLINDPSPYVSATALKHPPAGSLMDSVSIKRIRKLLFSGSAMIRNAAGYLVCSRDDTLLSNLRKTVLEENRFTPDVVNGLCETLRTREDFRRVFHLAGTLNKPVATAAYRGLTINLDTLLIRQIITTEDRDQFIISGLQSQDPVQIYLAADYILSSNAQINNISKHLYRCLNQTEYQYLEAQLKILGAIEKVKPEDAPERLISLLSSEHNQLRQAAYHILTDIYQKHLSPPIPKTDRCIYQSLNILDKYGLSPAVLVETTRGHIVIRCDAYHAPYTVAAFLNRVKDNYYDGLVFHRVVPNFVIQTGDPRGDGWGGPGNHLRTERSPLSYETGRVGMASAGPDTEGSQFFITTAPQYHLDGNYTLFGTVIKGIGVAEQIELGDKIISTEIVDSL